MDCNYLVVGAGLYGSVIAERIAHDLGEEVLVIDKRDHIGGNCFSDIDPDTGIEYHVYGTHIFHTSSPEVWNYITRFTEFNGYYHQVLTVHKGRVYQMPINLETINAFYNRTFSPKEARDFITNEISAAQISTPSNLEEMAISRIGRPLYEAFVKEYTKKQWGKDPTTLPAAIVNRLPVRFNYNENYFNEARWQGIPLQGYTDIFRKLLSSPKIKILLNTDFLKHREQITVNKKVIYTGPIDAFFQYQFGPLEWRSVSFTREIVETDDFQGTSVMNYADADVPYTRVHEPRHLHPERNYAVKKTLLMYERSGSDQSDPTYPINSPHNTSTLQNYRTLTHKHPDTIIGGRLGDYAYYDMDKTILAALETYQKRIKENR